MRKSNIKKTCKIWIRIDTGLRKKITENRPIYLASYLEGEEARRVFGS